MADLADMMFLCAFLVIVSMCWASFEVGVEKGDCFSILTKDGYLDQCLTDTQRLQADPATLAKYSELLVVVYRPSTGVFHDSVYITEDRFPFAFNSPEVKDAQQKGIVHIWPRASDHVAAYIFDLHFHDTLNRPVGAICVYIVPVEGTVCTDEKSGPNTITIGELKPGQYTAYYYNAGSADPVRNSIAQASFAVAGNKGALPGHYQPEDPLAHVPNVQEWLYTNDWTANGSGTSEANSAPAHAFVMSVRTAKRYRECEVMLKSLLFNRGTEGDVPPLALHLVVDKAGRVHFKKLWDKMGLERRLSNVAWVLHPFNEVCEEACDSFLKRINMDLSFHHSGRAGYCRLFIPRYFQNLKSRAESLGYPADLLPDKIMSIETDQLMLTSVHSLWAEFDGFGPDTLVAAAENYQPWGDSRPFEGVNGKVDYEEVGISGEAGAVLGGDVNGTVLHDGSYHGYGIIGGIMLIHLDRIQDRYLGERWLDVAADSVAKYRSERPDWKVKLNDQDIFNVMFTTHPAMLKVLGCEWNVQFHARLNTFIQCYVEAWEKLQLVDSDMKPEGAWDVPLNCDRSRERNIFVCEKTARVLHYMAGSYSDGSEAGVGVMQYYHNAWSFYYNLGWAMLNK